MPRPTPVPATQFEARVLNAAEVIEAKKLIYQVFVIEQQWNVPPDNPTQIRANLEMLHDRYDAVAVWFGIFHNNTLVACSRAVGKLQGCFELEDYHPLPSFLTNERAALELNRLAVKKEYRATCAILALASFQLQYFLANSIDALFTTSVFPKPGNFYVRRFGFIKDAESFRYHPDDPSDVYLLHMDASRMQETLKNLNNSLEGKSVSLYYQNA